MNESEDFEDEQPDQTVTYGGYVAPLPANHWSLQPSWRKYKESLSEDVPADASEVVVDWKGFAGGLAGCSEETA